MNSLGFSQETLHRPLYMLTWENGMKNDVLGLERSFEVTNGTQWAYAEDCLVGT
jgi:hypothetical protein